MEKRKLETAEYTAPRINAETVVAELGFAASSLDGETSTEDYLYEKEWWD